MKACFLTVVILSGCAYTHAQLPVTIPWSSSVNMTFENGATISPGFSDFMYTPNQFPGPGAYSILTSNNDAGHLFFGPFTSPLLVAGNKMVVSYTAPFSGKIILAILSEMFAAIPNTCFGRASIILTHRVAWLLS